MIRFFGKKENKEPQNTQAQSEEPGAVQEEKSWLGKLTSGLGKTSSKLTTGIASVITKRKLDDDMLESLEEVLLTSDMGVATASAIISTLAKERYDKEISPEEVASIMADEITAILEPVAVPLQLDGEHHKPQIVLVAGVNGNGKTTSVGKLAKQFSDAGHTVMLVACDTFRAAAVEQLVVWGERSGCEIVTGKPESDPASVAFSAIEQARANGTDIVLIDTAGRLQNKTNLMEQLKKIVRVIQKIDETAPHHRLMVLDATTGQNAHSQLEAFKEAIDISGLVITKLDGSAKGGVVVALAKSFGLPIHAIGVGEGIEDLHAFKAREFAERLVDIKVLNS